MSTFRLAQEFMRIESIGPRNGVQADRADPLWLHVRVTSSDDMEKDIESAMLEGADTYGIVVTERSRHPYRISTGVWGYDIDPILYSPGKTYMVHWRHAMQPKVMGVIRSTFVWQPPPFKPRSTTGCILHGVLSRGGGLPISGARIVVEEYRDAVTLNHRIDQIDVSTDAFGTWWCEVEHNTLQRVVFGEQAKTVKIPPLDSVSLKDLKEYQPGDVRKDVFGYPLPDHAPQRVPLSTQMTKAPINPTTSVTILNNEGGQAFEFVQVVPVAIWTITHPLSTRPTVTVIDTAGEEVIGSVDHPSDDTVVISFLVPMAGTARLT